MNSKYMKLWISVVLATIVLASCQSDYTKMVKEELAKGVRKDSILLGINFGDTRQEFYGRCFDLNKQKLVMESPGNNAVQYIFTDSLQHNPPREIRVFFFPNFDNQDKIAEMQMEFSYMGSAMYDKSYQADSLKEKLKDILVAWYKGNDFVNAEVQDEDLPVKVDGNRRIIVYNHDVHSVMVRVQDILHPAFQHSITKEKESVQESSNSK
jgi:hypothetical protein